MDLSLVELRNALGRAIVVLPVTIPLSAIAKRDAIAEARRLLG